VNLFFNHTVSIQAFVFVHNICIMFYEEYATAFNPLLWCY